MAVAMMRSLLSRTLAPTDLNRIEAVWHRDGPPMDAVDRILKVQETPAAWHSLLLPREPNDDPETDRTPPPREPRPPRGGW